MDAGTCHRALFTLVYACQSTMPATTSQASFYSRVASLHLLETAWYGEQAPERGGTSVYPFTARWYTLRVRWKGGGWVSVPLSSGGE